jgi:hypothetical protein
MRVVHMGLWRVREDFDPAVLAMAQQLADFEEMARGDNDLRLP